MTSELKLIKVNPIKDQWSLNSDLVYILDAETGELWLFLKSETVTSICGLLKEQFTQI